MLLSFTVYRSLITVVTMDNQEIRTLQLLEEFEKEENPSQRALARKLNVSLGLVNSFIKRLARKGYFKITNLPANRVGYILTPQGAAEKTRLTYKYIQYSFNYYRQARAKLRKIMARLEKQGKHSLVFWGTGELAEIAYVSMQESSVQLIAVIDEESAGEFFFGKRVIGADNLQTHTYDSILITSITSVEDIHAKLVEKNIPAEKIITL